MEDIMQEKIIQEIYSDLINHLTDKQFLKTIKLSKKTMLGLLRQENWIENIRFIIKQEKISCRDVLTVCEHTLHMLSEEPKAGWLPSIFEHTLHQMFPENADGKMLPPDEASKLFYLEVLRRFLCFERRSKGFQPKIHMQFLNEDAVKKTEAAEEYFRLLKLFRENYLYEFMRIGSEITRHKTLSHICGVHYIVMHVGRQLLNVDIPIDIALVSGAAIGHDIGKYGCKPKEIKRIPYLHYYYTDKYFKRNLMPTIGHIATNHSTWDLELENLSVESLVLIYADFRVKGGKDPEGMESIQFYDLKDAFDVILNKLDDVDEAKKDRYIKVYNKLRDFEEFMINLGINTDLSTSTIQMPEWGDPVLYHSEDAVRSLKHLAIQHNIHVMHKLNSQAAFGDIMEAARSEKNWKNIRAYINIFGEYFTYMTQKQKIVTLNFLYELLMHREGDIRRQSADLIGNIIVHSDEEYRKELPEGVQREADEITSLALWDHYLNIIISPDHKVTEQHKRWLGYTLKFVISSALERCKKEELRKYLESFLRYYHTVEYSDSTAFILLDSILALPLTMCTEDDKHMLMEFTRRLTQRKSLEVQIAALRFMEHLSEAADNREKITSWIKDCLNRIDSDEVIGIQYLKYEINNHLGFSGNLSRNQEGNLTECLYQDPETVSEIFLENLKAATPWVLKAVNIELLLSHIRCGATRQILQVAAHFSNLIKVSERVAVRHRAGQALLSIIPLLTLSERNEVAVELSKGLEIGEYEFSKYIPEYLGVLALHLHPNELDEMILDYKKLLDSTNDRVSSVTLNTLGIMLENYPSYMERFHEDPSVYHKRRETILGLILKGLSNFHDVVNQEALLVIGQYFFGTSKLTLEEKQIIFELIYKKLLVLISDHKETELSFFNSAASLNHIYRFLSDYLFLHKEYLFPVMEKVAFFPGTFDPFSLGHKGVVMEIKKLGYEVYLAIDEFSWSKRTQPKMIRRKLLNMSVADEMNVYLFPDHIPVNLGNPEDLKNLKTLFPHREIYIVVGSDVIEEASAYQAPRSENSIHSFHHIIFQRNDSEQDDPDGKKRSEKWERPTISGNVIELALPRYMEEISSTRIRDNIDFNRDIANLIDPLAQSYIYDNSLYLREPQYKNVFGTKGIEFEFVKSFSKKLIGELSKTLLKDRLKQHHSKHYLEKAGVKGVLIRDGERNNIPVALATFHEAGMAELADEFGSMDIASEFRRGQSGKTVILSGILFSAETANRNLDQLALTEALAYCLQNDFTYAIYHHALGTIDKGLIALLNRQGFLRIMENCGEEPIYGVDLKAPVTLFCDIETTVKEPFPRREKVRNAIEEAHKRLQHSLVRMYPGQLILSFDAIMMYHRIMERITAANHVPKETLFNRALGESMCVPFGKMLHGMAVPNTVTKSLHTEKRFDPGINRFQIAEFPNYSPLINQIKTIKSFRRPVILVDDLLHKGYRMKELDPLFKQEKIDVSKLIVGILSGRGKELMTLQGRTVESVYFIPNLQSWFVESNMYPFIGGDSVNRKNSTKEGFLSSINLILPYVAPNFLKNVPKAALYDFSMTCLENARSILSVLEEEYEAVYERKLTLNRLSEALIFPRYPDKGIHMSYDPNLAPSVYIANDIETLMRLENLIE